MKEKNNWASWSIAHRQLIYFFTALLLIAGLYSYKHLGRSEDPTYAVKQMVVSAAWPGATAAQVEAQVTDKLEKELQNIPNVEKIISYSRPGMAVITVHLQDQVPPKQLRQRWLELRNVINDMAKDLPSGVYGPYFNDRFDDVYGNIYALTGPDYSYEELRRQALLIQQRLQTVKEVQKVELEGEQEQALYVELNKERLATLGIDINTLASLIKAQTTPTPAGMVDQAGQNSYLRLTSLVQTKEELESLPINSQGKILRLKDIATIRQAYADPPTSKFYYNSQPALGLALSMEEGGNNITLGENLDRTIKELQSQLPLGMELHQVANQPQVVKAAIDDFTESLYLAVVIVLGVSLLTLGRRCGYIISCCIPLILLGTFTLMYAFNIDLHKISLGTLILALGMLVDDSIVVVELMEVRMREGYPRKEAAAYAFKACAWPLLIGTIITCLGFMPIALAKSASSEFASALFPVMTITLLLSWVISSTLAPVLGYHWLQPASSSPEPPAPEANKSQDQAQPYTEPYKGSFYEYFRRLLTWSLQHRLTVLGLTLGCFLAALACLPLVKQEFFPPSVRPELLVEINMPEGTSIKATDAATQKLAQLLEKEEGLDHLSAYVGKSAPRFVLVMEPVQPRDNYAQLIIVAKDVKARQKLEARVQSLSRQHLPEALIYAKTIALGPPAPYPVMLRVSGKNPQQVKYYAQRVQQVMAAHPKITMTRLDWLENTSALSLNLDQERLSHLGLTRQQVATALQVELSGYTAAKVLQGDKEIPVILKLRPEDRHSLEQVQDLLLPTAKGPIPLSQLTTVAPTSEAGMLWRRNTLPTITINGGIVAGTTGNDVTKEVYANLASLRQQLPPGLTIEIGGSTEDSAKTLGRLLEPVPIMVLAITILLMVLFQSMTKVAIILATAPMGLIGVILGLLLFNAPLGFMAELGALALSGTIIRNSMVLVDQIQQNLDQGHSLTEAVIEASVVRFRPIMLAAFTTVLGLVPLFFSQFWHSMAVTIACGLTGATLLTLVVLPVLYSLVFSKSQKTQE